MNLVIPDFCLLLLVGVSGAGKTTFARRHFRSSEILSSDSFRAMISDDESDQSATLDAFAALHLVAGYRLARRHLTVIDATNLQPDARRPLLDLARRYHCPTAAIVFNLPAQVAYERNAARPERSVDGRILARQQAELERTLPRLRWENLRPLYVLETVAQVDAAVVVREPLAMEHRDEQGPFDIVGDIHGCFDELAGLLAKLGYGLREDGREYVLEPPAGRKLVFLGDLVDHGPMAPQVLRLVMGAVAAGQAFCVPGNHDDKLMRYLAGQDVKVTNGLGDTLAQMALEPPEFAGQVERFLCGLPDYLWLDGGRLVAAHAGLPEDMIGRGSFRVRQFALYGQTSDDLPAPMAYPVPERQDWGPPGQAAPPWPDGHDSQAQVDELSLPQRMEWAREYHGRAKVVYGHTPVAQPRWLNNTINIDTGCIYGGALSVLRYPELEIVSVPARYIYAQTRRDFLAGKPFPPAYPHGNESPDSTIT
ncbi:MAG TPA: AAA family ATPase [Anaerolineaceae bacterium]|nr:AAA family ATPase [Anaerolineaceae bacterium]